MRKYLKKIIQSRKIPHAFILNRATKDDAIYFAKSILCASSDGEPCETCRSCRQINSGSNPDVIFIGLDKTKKTLGVDDAREKINNAVIIKPYSYKYKIFIIENADLLTPGAQNALLRVLEEPPSYGVFLLAAENLKMFLPTVLSRCVLLKNPLPPLSPTGMEIIEPILNLKTARQVFEISKEKSDSAQSFLRAAAVWFRDILVYMKTGDEKLIINRDKIALITSLKYSGEYVIRILDAINDALFDLSRNANAELTLNVALLSVIDGYNPNN